VQDKQIQIAADYMISQVKADRASDFLTSDLMPYLEQLDGGKWFKSSL
jgi:malate synthase